MSTGVNTTSHQVGDGSTAHWGLIGTVLWGLVIAAVFVVLQTFVTLAVILRGKRDVTEQQLQTLVEAAQNNGVALSLATLATALICVPLLAGVAKLKKGANIVDYFALRRVSRTSLLRWLGALAVFIALADALSLLLGRPVVPETMREVYSSARPVWLLWLALVVAAPLFEETFFRGFLFRGFSSSFLRPNGAVLLTAGLFAAIHYGQYDLYDISIVFLLGLLLGLARMKTGSLLVPLTLHAAANTVAGIEAALLG